MGHQGWLAKRQGKSIQDSSACHGSLSKHRSGLSKRASELCTLCFVQAAVVISFPCGKAYPLCHPCADKIVMKLPPPGTSDSGSSQDTQGDQVNTFDALKKEYAAAVEELKQEKQQVEKLKQAMKPNSLPWWMNAPADQLGLKELKMLEQVTVDLESRLRKQLEKFPAQTSTAPVDPSAGGGAVDPNDHGVGKEE